MPRSLHREQVGLPTSRQRALVLLVLVNAGGRALHPIEELHPALGGKVPLQTMWNILAALLSYGQLRAVGTNDRRAGFALTARGATQAVREIEAEATRPLADYETMMRGDAERLGLRLPYRDLFQPSLNGVPDARRGDGGSRSEEGQVHAGATVTVRIENNYACGRSSGGDHEVPAPPVNASEEDLDGWWPEHVESLIGDGHDHGANEESWYVATIVAAPGRPELVGLDWKPMDT